MSVDAWKSVDQTLEGNVSMGSQYHFYMENQVRRTLWKQFFLDSLFQQILLF